MRWLTRILFLLIVSVIFLFAAGLWMFEKQKTAQTESLESNSILVQTKSGEVELSDSGGTGPVVLVFHGAPGGYDQAELLGSPLARAGFRVLAISRPGYLRTPLSSGFLPEQQADLAAALLHAMKIPTAGVLGFAEGSAAAVLACLRHPKRFRALALVTPIILSTKDFRRDQSVLPGGRISKELTGDMASGWWVFASQYRPVSVLQQFFELQTNLIPYECWKIAKTISETPDQLTWFQTYVKSLAPLSLRETGTRNDLLQFGALFPLPLARLKQPLLVLRGELDAVTPIENFKTLQEKVPHGNFQLIPGAGFLLPGVGTDSKNAEDALTEFFQKELYSP